MFLSLALIGGQKSCLLMHLTGRNRRWNVRRPLFVYGLTLAVDRLTLAAIHSPKTAVHPSRLSVAENNTQMTLILSIGENSHSYVSLLFIRA